MWELEFEVVELARASSHGRAQMRREARVRHDEPVTVFREDGYAASGFCLDRSPSGVRMILDACCEYAVGEHVTVILGGDTLPFRVVWAYAEGDACVLGLERAIFESGEFPILPYAEDMPVSRTLASRVA
jgi:hypothetical protein